MRIFLIPAVLAAIAPTVLAVDSSWYQNGVIYQIYLRSFKDTDGDGIGDLKGVIDKIDYLVSLNIAAVWFSPIYPSPNDDFGYDISDYFSINPEYGTMEHFKNVITKLKEKGIRVLMDFIPNHSSTRNGWFVKSENRSDPYTDFYVWQDPLGYDVNNKPIPPNNWLSAMYTGSAWKWSEKRKQFYLHNFLDGQADHNFRNPDVHKKMEELLKFWMDLGVSGFRVDSISWIYEDEHYLNEPISSTYNPRDPYNYTNLVHIYTMDLSQNLEYVKEVRHFVEEYTKSNKLNESKFLILEIYSPLNTVIPYYGDKDHPGAIPFNYLLFDMTPSSTSADYEKAIKKYFSSIGENEPNWIIGNHDWKRVATRWSEDWVDILNMLMLTLRGTAITYYGEEIGLEDNIIRWDQLKDVQGIVAGEAKYKSRSRDFQRGPFPWDNSHLGGFTTAPQSWVPLAPSYWWKNAKAQEAAERSHLKVYRALTKLRQEETFRSGDCDVKSMDNDVLYVIRTLKDNPTYITILNMGDDIINVNLKTLNIQLPNKMELKTSSINYPNYKLAEVDSQNIILQAKSGIVVSS